MCAKLEWKEFWAVVKTLFFSFFEKKFFIYIKYEIKFTSFHYQIRKSETLNLLTDDFFYRLPKTASNPFSYGFHVRGERDSVFFAIPREVSFPKSAEPRLSLLSNRHDKARKNLNIQSSAARDLIICGSLIFIFFSSSLHISKDVFRGWEQNQLFCRIQHNLLVDFIMSAGSRDVHDNMSYVDLLKCSKKPSIAALFSFSAAILSPPIYKVYPLITYNEISARPPGMFHPKKEYFTFF